MKYTKISSACREIVKYLIGVCKDSLHKNIVTYENDGDGRALFVGLSPLTYMTHLDVEDANYPNIWVIACCYDWYGCVHNDPYMEFVEAGEDEYVASLYRHDTFDNVFVPPAVAIDSAGKISVVSAEEQRNTAFYVELALLDIDNRFNVIFTKNMNIPLPVSDPFGKAGERYPIPQLFSTRNNSR